MMQQSSGNNIRKRLFIFIILQSAFVSMYAVELGDTVIVFNYSDTCGNIQTRVTYSFIEKSIQPFPFSKIKFEFCDLVTNSVIHSQEVQPLKGYEFAAFKIGFFECFNETSILWYDIDNEDNFKRCYILFNRSQSFQLSPSWTPDGDSYNYDENVNIELRRVQLFSKDLFDRLNYLIDELDAKLNAD